MSDPSSLAYLKLFYSGGGANSTPSLSIGGAISSVAVPIQSATGTGVITGVTINSGMGNTVGDGTLTYTASTHTFTWTPKNGSAGTGVVVSEDGTYFIQGASNSGGISITIVYNSLPTSTTSDVITIANQTEKFFANLTEEETLAGVTKYHCFAIKNTHATKSIVGIINFIASNTPGADTISLYLDPIVAGTGGTGPTAVANENTAPGGSTFVIPDSYTHTDKLSTGTLTAGQCRFIWVKQLVPPNVTETTLENTFAIGVYMRGKA